MPPLLPRAALTLAAVSAAALLAGCGSAGSTASAPTTPPMPQTFQAEAVARQEFGLLAGGGWIQAWSLWDATSQQAISGNDFAKLNTECKPAVGIPYVIDKSTKLDQDTVRVDWHHGADTGSNTLAYQQGKWRFTPDATALAAYRTGVDQLVQQRQAAGSCH
ncbi:hypothetical protein ACFYNO_22365 [Kitasatospora sp. NPDC006697]|uniref:hypothetical protein n=1 Tax=Kitasatospora sp. NPDC006697 TaxID=3364020 RepID=UPI00367E19A4